VRQIKQWNGNARLTRSQLVKPCAQRTLLVVVLLLGLMGCREPPTWSAESRSPDGMWIATAHTVEYGGFGTNAVETTVEIKRPGKHESAERVLGFAEGGRDMGLSMRWDGSSRLMVSYHGAPELLYYQVVRTSGVDISVQNAPADQPQFHPSARP
jgi:hypothetical protein